jgi:hypothetical protein
MQGLVIACEPVPAISDCLQHNVAAHWVMKQQTQQQGRHEEQGEAQQQQQQGRQPDPQAARQRELADYLPARVVTLNVGVGSGEAAAASFTFYPRAAGWSTMQPAEADVAADMGAFLEAALASPAAAAAAGLGPAAATLGCWLRRYAPGWVYDAAWRMAVSSMLGAAQTVACPLVSLSQLIEQHGLATIDLLKVDVERAELDVLRGVKGELGSQGLYGWW